MKLVTKNKILFFTDAWFIHFGIAKFLQNNNKYTLYSIIDVDDKVKSFFKKQKLVHYSKVWYYLDNISLDDKEPDLGYLQKFEKKYNINIWSIIYTDRAFYPDYNNFYKFNESEILRLIEQECRFYEKVLDESNPDFLALIQTDTHYNHLLYKMCQARGTKILMMVPIRFGNRVAISQYDNAVDLFEDNIQGDEMTMEEVEAYQTKYDVFPVLEEYMKSHFQLHKFARYKSIIKFFVYPISDSFKLRYIHFGKSKSKVLAIKILNLIRRKRRSFFINKNLVRKIDDNDSFIYFPLHFEPERVLLIEAFYYSEQLTIIKNIAKSLPVGYKLYVKEHPGMETVYWRDKSFYNQIRNLPNVRLLHPSVNPKEIVKKCSLVITIAGTTGQEAALQKKPVIVFTDQIYNQLPSVIKLNNIEELPNAIKNCLNLEIDSYSIGKYVDTIHKNSFEFNIVTITSDFAYRFGFKGPVMDAEISQENITKFFDDYKEDFERLAFEHEKKIERMKKLSSDLK